MAQIVAPTDDMIAEAARMLRAGGVVGFPTETVYGLGADTFNPAALEKIYKLKGRPFNNPLIAHVLDWQQAKTICDIGFTKSGSSPAPTSSQSKIQNQKSKIDRTQIDRLTAAFWPGPLTLVLPRTGKVPDRATAGLPTIAVRSPAHPVARRLLECFGGPISAPSANRSGHVSPTAAPHVAEDFSDQPLLILDGGPCEVGIESTVLDLTASPPRILRSGSVTAEQLCQVIGEVRTPHIVAQDAAPGTAERHYAPRTPAELIAADALPDRLQSSTQPLAVLALHATDIAPPHRAIAMPKEPGEYARMLYSALRRADAIGCSRILIEAPPQTNDLWRAIHDRLHRATASRA